MRVRVEHMDPVTCEHDGFVAGGAKEPLLDVEVCGARLRFTLQMKVSTRLLVEKLEARMLDVRSGR